MRTRVVPVLASAVLSLGAGSAHGAELGERDLLLLNRLTWGASAPDAAQFASLGREAWLERQLRPPQDDRLPKAAQAEIDALSLSREQMAARVMRMEAESRAAAKIADPGRRKAAQQAYQQALAELAREAAQRSLLRALYSPNQLKEQTTWFWFNHFNVHQAKRGLRAMVGDYEDQAIRPHALGRFRDLLEATLKHPAMLRYLDNDLNSAGHINENYAREIMELHTMGVGSGYTQKDVQELARILTGVGVNLTPTAPRLRPADQPLYRREGLFEFNPARHDFGDKVFLGNVIKGSGFSEVEQALDILARQPATAHHVSLRLAAYYLGEAPPPALVDRMAETFRQTDGDIAATLRTLVASPEFDASLGKGFKDPAHYVISAVRFAFGDRLVRNTVPMQGWLNRLGEGLYAHQTPDGYPLGAASWNGSGQMTQRFEFARWVGSGPEGLFQPWGGARARPAAPAPPKARFDQRFSYTLAAPTRAALAQAKSPQEWNALLISSPEFMRR
jgi:uncharacterized protein (DUF1800 family)